MSAKKLLSILSIMCLAALMAPVLTPARAAFPGTNGKIAYVKDPPGSAPASVSTHIWVMNADGSGQVDVSGSAGFLDSAPAWSPDASKIAFSSKRGSTFNIWVMNADGSGQTNLTKNAFEGVSYPAWSPDGTKIAFVVATEGLSNSEVYTMNADGSSQVQLTNTPKTDPLGYSESDPQWSPDGTRLVYVEGSSCGGTRGVFVINSDGTNRQKIVTSENGARSCLTYPTWSPDGSRIVFIDGSNIWVVNPDGTNAVEIASSIRAFDGLAWSPDGTKLISGVEPTFNCGCRDLFAFSIDGSGEQQLAVAVESEYLPDWAPVPPPPPECTSGEAICGGDGDDEIEGTTGDDLIYAAGGNDTIEGGGGDDTIIGGSGDDTLIGGDGDDTLIGDESADDEERAGHSPGTECS